MMLNVRRSQYRAFLLAHVFMYGFMGVMTYQLNTSIDLIEWFAIVIFAVSTVAYAFDVAIVLRYMPTILARNKFNPDEAKTFYEMASFSDLRDCAKESAKDLTQIRATTAYYMNEAKAFPELQTDRAFNQAIGSFRFDKAHKILMLAKKAKEYSEAQSKRRQGRTESRMTRLLAEAEVLGLHADQTSHLGQAALRDLVEQTREAVGLRAKAQALGCSSFIEQKLQGLAFGEAKEFLVYAESLIDRAKRFNEEAIVRELIAYGNTDGANKLLKERQDASDLRTLREDLSARIHSLEPEHHASRLHRLDAACIHPYGTREFKKAIHELERSITALSK